MIKRQLQRCQLKRAEQDIALRERLDRTAVRADANLGRVIEVKVVALRSGCLSNSAVIETVWLRAGTASRSGMFAVVPPNSLRKSSCIVAAPPFSEPLILPQFVYRNLRMYASQTDASAASNEWVTTANTP